MQYLENQVFKLWPVGWLPVFENKELRFKTKSEGLCAPTLAACNSRKAYGSFILHRARRLVL